MAAIFFLSGTPSTRLPAFGSVDYFVKKGGHVAGYAVLALIYRRALGGVPGRARLAWVLAVLYGLLDEFHQSFVPGRHPSLVDALLFDGGGAAIALWISWRLSPAGRHSL
jgi:VanZ family protein